VTMGNGAVYAETRERVAALVRIAERYADTFGRFPFAERDIVE